MGIYSGKKLLVLAGKPIGSEDIVHYARANGAYTIVTDNLAIEQSPAKRIADEFWDISTADVSAISKRIKDNKIDAVFTGVHEFNIWRTLEVCKACDLPFYSSEDQFRTTSVKSDYKKLFKEFQIPVIEDFILSDDNVAALNNTIDFPVLLKPVDGSGSYGISICYNEAEFQKGFEKAKAFSSSKKVLVEKYIQAKEVTIFYLVHNGRIMLSAMADRHTDNGTQFTVPLPVLYTFPSIHLQTFQSKYNEKFVHAFESLQIQNGMLFIQAFVEEDVIIPYDIGFRLTGTQEYHILEKLCGYNPLKMMVDYAFNGKMDLPQQATVDPTFNGQQSFNITILVQPCQIGSFIGIEEIERMDGVIKVIKNYQFGDTIQESAIGTLNQVGLRILGTASSREEMKNLIRRIVDKVDVLSAEGTSVMLPPINIDNI